MVKRSICMATFNGAKYLRKQIESILYQMGLNDELIISDDGSSDETISIINSYNDKRIRLYLNNGRHGVSGNFENALKHSNGEIIFLSDQDDVWLDGRLDIISDIIEKRMLDFVICNCCIINGENKIIVEEYYNKNRKYDKSVVSNIYKTKWIGCCMAFKREVLNKALPIPLRLSSHDVWIGLISHLYYKCGYVPEILHQYRRHGNNVSCAGEKSSRTLKEKLKSRKILITELMKRIIAIYFGKHKVGKK